MRPAPNCGMHALYLVPLLAIAICSIVVLAIAGNTFFLTSTNASEKAAIKLIPYPGASISRDAIILAKRLYQRWTDDLIIDDLSLRELGRQIDLVLTQIRNRHPAMIQISARQRHRPAVLLLKLEGDLLDAVVGRWKNSTAGVLPRTGHAAFDALNTKLGLHKAKVLPSFATVIMYLSGFANLRAVREAYAAIDGIRRASFDESLGDGSDIVAANLGGTWYIVMRNAWGDCPSGCMNSETSFFIVKREHIARMEREKAEDIPQFWAVIPALRRENWFP